MRTQVGDALACEGAHYSVASVAVCRDAATPWTQFGLSPVGHERDLVLVEVRGAPFAAGSVEPQWELGAPAVTCGGVTYRLGAQGRAPLEQEARDGPRRFDRAQFWLYEGPEGALVLDGQSHASRFSWVLRPLDPDHLEVYSASGA